MYLVMVKGDVPGSQEGFAETVRDGLTLPEAVNLARTLARCEQRLHLHPRFLVFRSDAELATMTYYSSERTR